MKFSTDQITKLLTFYRALNPGSKRYTLISSDFFFEPFDDCSLDDIYHALDIIADNKDDLQTWIYEKSQKIIPRDMFVSYFDCTNYYFDISRPDSIVEMGLLMDYFLCNNPKSLKKHTTFWTFYNMHEMVL